MTEAEKSMLDETRYQLGMSNVPRECKVVLRVALEVYTHLMELNPATWKSSEWRDPYRQHSWKWLVAREPVEVSQEESPVGEEIARAGGVAGDTAYEHPDSAPLAR